MSEIAAHAQSKVRGDDQGGFPAQQQDPPGLTRRMEPVPDHGEISYVSGTILGVTGGGAVV